MSKKKRIPGWKGKPCIVHTKSQNYFKSGTGQMVRIDPEGRSIPRIRMSKKKKLKLRKELHKVNEMDSHELANKIVDSVKSTPVVNPKSEEQLKKETGESE